MHAATVSSSTTAEPIQNGEALFALRAHWPEYLIEAAALALFMISACIFGVLLEHPISPLHHAIQNADIRRAAAGAALGLTAIAIICSPWGQRSGAHMNPSVTLAFLSLGKITRWDAAYYVFAQFFGGIAGVGLSRLLIGGPLTHSAVNYVTTVPVRGAAATAFGAEFLISAILMFTILSASNSAKLAWLTPFLAGTLVTLFIAIEAPLSGMSMNPARTLGSAIWAWEWTGLWIYFSAPILGMLVAAQLYRACWGERRVLCAKLLHGTRSRCIFRCGLGKPTLDGARR